MTLREPSNITHTEARVPTLGRRYLPLYATYDLADDIDCVQQVHMDADEYEGASVAVEHIDWLIENVEDRFFLQSHSIRHSELEKKTPKTAMMVAMRYRDVDPYLNILTAHFDDERDLVAFLNHAYGGDAEFS